MTAGAVAISAIAVVLERFRECAVDDVVKIYLRSIGGCCGQGAAGAWGAEAATARKSVERPQHFQVALTANTARLRFDASRLFFCW